MQRKLFVLMAACLLLFTSLTSINLIQASSAAPELQWSKTYGHISAYGITQASDGNLLVAAQQADGTVYTGHLAFHYKGTRGVLLEINLNGAVLSNKTLPIRPIAMAKTAEGNLIILGDVQSLYGYTTRDFDDNTTYPIYQNFASLAKITEKGDIIWKKVYHLPEQPLRALNETAYFAGDIGTRSKFLLQLNDGGYLLGGWANFDGSVFNPTGRKAWLIRTDSLGNSIWAKTYGTDESYSDKNFVNSAVQTSDGGFLFAGDVNGFGLIKIDSSGNVEWSKEQGNNNINSIIQTEDNGYLYLDNSSWIKIDENYNQLWNKTDVYTGFIYKNIEKNYLFSSKGGLLYKTDFDGNIIWACVCNSTTLLTSTNDGGYAFAGAKSSDSSSLIQTSNIFIEKLSAPNESPSPSVPELHLESIVILAVSISALLSVVKVVKTRRGR
jgi:hypothetical protein